MSRHTNRAALTMNAPIERTHWEIFGSVASLAVVGAIDPDGLQAAQLALTEIDERLSPWRAESEISRIRDSTLALIDADPRTQAVLAACESLRLESDGYFDARSAGSDGGLDPSGLVKGLAIGAAHQLLRAARMSNSAFGIGGDISASGNGPGGVGWVVGISDPLHRDQAFTRVALRDCAIATSGETERPGHLRGRSISPWLSVSVVGPSIERVDALATILYLEGAEGMARIEREPGTEALAIDRARHALRSSGFAALEV